MLKLPNNKRLDYYFENDLYLPFTGWQLHILPELKLTRDNSSFGLQFVWLFWGVTIWYGNQY